MQVDHREFETVACVLVSHLTPKMKKYADTAIEFALSIGGSEYFFRAYAPSNYRQVWAKLPGQRKGSDKKEINGWVKLADHDSCWTEGLRVFEYTNNGTLPVDWQEIRYGKIPRTRELDRGFHTVDTEKGEHLAPLAHVVDLKGLSSRFEFYALILKLVYENGDQLRAIFESTVPPGGKRRDIQVVDEETLERVPSERDRVAAKKAAFSGDGMAALLGKGEWRLRRLFHHREGHHFL